ncbi:Z1 domain-containing protein [Collimonas sp. PA-H2]|uniref:Z1 domain-containing protein n=1 Tax=Collimonas sp. PA-H2 TaxID=1881062 RepID=UPI000BF92ADE|nr:Z1 domain-containing protein [Collimonas sp. PA-H2]PFH09728.1 Z1 domain-containing protein [Collimonas sp. PA-H2]
MKHCDQVLNLLRKQVSNPSEADDIKKTAAEVASKWVDPLTGDKEETNGLIYGLVQSGKTGVMTVTGAMGADEGYRTIIILTSDIDPLYEQTLGRAQEAFPGIDILGKKDIRDTDSFLQRIKGGTCAIIVTKNSAVLTTLIQNFEKGRVRGLTCLIIDDEADQASLNTKAKRSDGSRSTINGLIENLRAFFNKNTYLQVTATPQALFLQDGNHAFRPKFTVLSHPGAEYVGGDDFFSNESKLVKEFPLSEIAVIAPGPQPTPTATIPPSLLRALDTFMVGATFKRTSEADQNCAFLCHVSTKTIDHDHIVNLLRKYKQELAGGLKSNNAAVIKRLRSAYEDLSSTHPSLARSNFDDLLSSIAFFSPGITVKLVNGETDEDVAVRSPYNLFVGGNKLGRGVTIKNLLVSYYGRNPRTPQADTVLQHARMYGYRRKDIGLLRLFLPKELHIVFRAINKMEQGLRELIATNPTEEFRGIYLEGGLNPTRKNVLVPGSIGVYTGGGNYNPSQITRDSSVQIQTSKLDMLLDHIGDKQYVQMPITEIQALIEHIVPDTSESERVWDTVAIAASMGQYAKLSGTNVGYVYVDRDRELQERRRETQGILSGGEVGAVPDQKLTLFLLRTKLKNGQQAAWWPQLRFPVGRYAFAFSI